MASMDVPYQMIWYPSRKTAFIFTPIFLGWLRTHIFERPTKSFGTPGLMTNTYQIIWYPMASMNVPYQIICYPMPSMAYPTK